MRKSVLALALAGVWVLVVVPTAWANVYTVNSTADSASGSCAGSICSDLRAAVAEANNNPGSTISLPEGQFELGPYGTHELQINADMTIVGEGPEKT